MAGSSRPASQPKSRGPRKKDVEAHVRGSEQEGIGLPRMVARIWALVSSISFIVNGGYLVSLVDTEKNKCIGAGVYMILVGVLTFIAECPCCFMPCPGGENFCQRMDRRIPFWVRGIIYIAFIVAPLALCFGVKTVISSMLFIMLGFLYFFLACIARSKKYERLQGEIKAQYNEKRAAATVTYGTLQSTINTVNAVKAQASAARVKKHSLPGKKPRPRGGDIIA